MRKRRRAAPDATIQSFRSDLLRQAEDRLCLQVFGKCVVAPFPAIARGLVAAERRHQIHGRIV